jgi:hypothetical protein
VDSCTQLNLNFDVLQQNDAAEFWDKLMDALEAGLKGTPAEGLLEGQCFGGRIVYQKIALKERHLREERREPFVKLEVDVKPTLLEGLDDFVKGEVMDGENQVSWEENPLCIPCPTPPCIPCPTPPSLQVSWEPPLVPEPCKKDTLRRSCLGQLPNLLTISLKRFTLVRRKQRPSAASDYI